VDGIIGRSRDDAAYDLVVGLAETRCAETDPEIQVRNTRRKQSWRKKYAGTFAVACALHQGGMLVELATDWYAPGQGWLRWIGSRFGEGKVQAALAARAEGVPDDLVRVRWKHGMAGKWIEQNKWSGGRLRKEI
jgi:hypothetical protein